MDNILDFLAIQSVIVAPFTFHLQSAVIYTILLMHDIPNPRLDNTGLANGNIQYLNMRGKHP